jgi:hypothetical protein
LRNRVVETLRINPIFVDVREERENIMQRLFIIRVLMLTAVLMMGSISAAAFQGSPGPQRPLPPPGVEHTITGTVAGNSIAILNESGIPIGATFSGGGRALDVGSCVLAGNLRFTPTDDPDITREQGEVLFTADNGDQLRAVIDALTSQTTKLTHGTLEFAGGTGRYSNARGSANIVVLHIFQTGFFEVTMMGKVIY